MTRLRIGVVLFVAMALVGAWYVSDLGAADKPTLKVRGTLPPYFKKLGLSSDQTKEIYQIRASYREQISELQAKIDALRKKERADLYKVLTAAQRQRLKELRSDEPVTEPTKPDKTKPAPTGKGKPEKP